MRQRTSDGVKIVINFCNDWNSSLLPVVYTVISRFSSASDTNTLLCVINCRFAHTCDCPQGHFGCILLHCSTWSGPHTLPLQNSTEFVSCMFRKTPFTKSIFFIAVRIWKKNSPLSGGLILIPFYMSDKSLHFSIKKKLKCFLYFSMFIYTTEHPSSRVSITGFWNWRQKFYIVQ